MTNNKLAYIAALAAAAMTLATGAVVQSANAAEVNDYGDSVYSWYTDTDETGDGINFANHATFAHIAGLVPTCGADLAEYTACTTHTTTRNHDVTTLYWGHAAVTAVDGITTTITDRDMPGIAPCEYEDGSDTLGACVWVSATMGNGEGSGVYYYNAGHLIAQY